MADDPVERSPGAGDGDPSSDDTPGDDAEVASAAARAAEGVVFSRYGRSDVDDIDVTVRFDGDVLEVDVRIDAPDAPADPDPERVVDDAVRAAEAAADDAVRAGEAAVDD